MFALKLKKLQYITLNIWHMKTSIKSPPVLQSTSLIRQQLDISNYMKIDSQTKPLPNIHSSNKTVTNIRKNVGQVIKQKYAVVTIMGHVNHGKTTLIDYLRKSNIAQNQDGGITQKIGAFRINCHGKRITFIDTPGHEAFTNIRERGASVTDLIILVVSAIEGVKKQTLEVIELIKKTKIPVIIAINKIDLPMANPLEVEMELQKAGLSLQINGGEIPIIHVSAKNGININLLCQLIVEETKNKTAVFSGLAKGSVLEANKIKNNFNSITIIVEEGTFKVGSVVVIKGQVFKIRSLVDDQGHQLKQAYPGQAVQIFGISFSPYPGDQVIEVDSMQSGKLLTCSYKRKDMEDEIKKNHPSVISAGKFKFERSREGWKEKKAFFWGVKEVWQKKYEEMESNIVGKIEEMKGKALKGKKCKLDIQNLQKQLQQHRLYGKQFIFSNENCCKSFQFMIKFGCRGMQQTALMQLQKLRNSMQNQVGIKLNLLKTGMGDVVASDIQEASLTDSSIFTCGSGVTPDIKKNLSDDQYVEPRIHSLVHSLINDIRNEAVKKKISLIKGNQKGHCTVMEMFNIKLQKGEQKVPGIKVNKGKILKKYKAYIFKNGIPITEGLSIKFIKCFKKEVVELKEGEEGTICLEEKMEQISKGVQIVFYDEN